MNVKDKLTEVLIDRLMDRLLRNAGLDSFVEHPERYEVVIQLGSNTGNTVADLKIKRR